MKNIALFLIILQLFSCVSTKNIAESRNSEYAAHNNFEIFRFWQELDILRFNNEKLRIKVLLVPEGATVVQFESDSQMIHIYDSLRIMIEEKMEGFRTLKKSYFDTTKTARLKIYKNLKSDSTDIDFLNMITNSPYFELYEDIVIRLRKSIQTSKFYSSQEEFEEYIRNRSIEIMDRNIYEKFFPTDTVSLSQLSYIQIDSMRESQIDFLITFSGSYNIDYSDQASGRIGSESISITLFDIKSATTVTTAKITHYWGNE